MVCIYYDFSRYLYIVQKINKIKFGNVKSLINFANDLIKRQARKINLSRNIEVFFLKKICIFKKFNYICKRNHTLQDD